MDKLRKGLIASIILISLYVILGNAPYIRVNPIVPGAVVAVNMIVVVLAGILFGRNIGAIVGFFATLINAMITGVGFEYAAIIPHTIMGYFSGLIKERSNNFVASFSIIIGHVLNIMAFIIIGIFAVSILTTSDFWKGIIYETIFGIITIMLLAYLYEGFFCKVCKKK